ncbi:hypothetical protein DM01DRAFT_77009 [Hesseltinella vesiculosa]|uniref:DASH complex subunit DAD2 n=1 Tax=Hesseltinella vesiculosa TaxID=101127 RepID=A0A1X2G346_9FUNG|nr:hypothetical protein DM01DRAFT_77009 [Hesseltinella vesiculosa]
MDYGARPQRQKMASAAKLAMIYEKQQELEELQKMKELSEHLVQHFENLTQSVESLAMGCKGVAQSLGNWDYVFRTMGSINTESSSFGNSTIVKLPQQLFTQIEFSSWHCQCQVCLLLHSSKRGSYMGANVSKSRAAFTILLEMFIE